MLVPHEAAQDPPSGSGELAPLDASALGLGASDLGASGTLHPLYRLQFSYARAWSVHLGGVHGGAGASYAVAYGSCQGHLEGEFAGENRPEHGEDGSTIPDFTGIISTTDGAAIAFETEAFRHTYLVDRRRMLVSVMHITEDPRYERLNGLPCVGVGEVTVRPGGRIEVTLDVAEMKTAEE
jgi:hypothetical protein